MTQLSLLDLKGTDTNLYAEIQWLPVDNLQPHPDNPRLIYREDIIDTIARSITESGFNPCYALLVRPLGTQYQIISGHTRHKAAIKAGCNSLPCWVKEIDDDAAFMELVLANNQGELSPLEYGIHVLKYVEVSEGGRGKKGGLSEYAKTIGKHDNTLRPYRDAAIVINAINLTDIRDVLDKANHIAAIHIYPRKNMTQSEKITQLILDYLVCLGKNDDDYDEKGEWEFELEEKLNAVYDAAWYSLGFPSLAEIQQIKASESEIMETVKHYSGIQA